MTALEKDYDDILAKMQADIKEICEIIYFQASSSVCDFWLADKIKRRIWCPP